MHLKAFVRWLNLLHRKKLNKLKVFVVNTGIISPLGLGVDANLKALLAMQHGLNCRSGFLDNSLSQFPVGKVLLENEELKTLLLVKEDLPRTSLLSLYAAREALENLVYNDLRLGFFSATTTGGMDKSEAFFKEYVPKTGKEEIRNVIYHTCGSATAQTARYLPPLSYVSTINTACSSSLNSVIAGARKIHQGMLDMALVGGSDALCRFTLTGFNSLLILDSQLCKPFDENRTGLNLGEGAAYLLLASEKMVNNYNLNPLCELVGYSNTNDAFHATASSDNGEGSFLAMKQALAKAGLQTSDIDYLNLHGTGTSNNDQSEAIAIRRVFGNDYPALSSTKAYTGHLLGASGSVELVFCTLAIREQVVFPNLRFETPIESTGIIPQTKLEHKKIEYVLSNSFGFGGNCSSIILKH